MAFHKIPCNATTFILIPFKCWCGPAGLLENSHHGTSLGQGLQDQDQDQSMGCGQNGIEVLMSAPERNLMQPPGPQGFGIKHLFHLKSFLFCVSV